MPRRQAPDEVGSRLHSAYDSPASHLHLQLPETAAVLKMDMAIWPTLHNPFSWWTLPV